MVYRQSVYKQVYKQSLYNYCCFYKYCSLNFCETKIKSFFPNSSRKRANALGQRARAHPRIFSNEPNSLVRLLATVRGALVLTLDYQSITFKYNLCFVTAAQEIRKISRTSTKFERMSERTRNFSVKNARASLLEFIRISFFSAV